MEEFLQCIGHRVSLKHFEHYRGGLDTIHGQTGLESLFTEFHGREIMFHVSTMLPYTEGDIQQVMCQCSSLFCALISLRAEIGAVSSVLTGLHIR